MQKRDNLSFYILIALTIVGAILRFASIDAPLWGDELSALSRIHKTLSDTIYYGVYLGDTHPAGIETLLWLWCKVADGNTILLRLPFVLMGIACIPLTYIIAKQWYCKKAGLCAAAIVALSQYTITYSNFTRPYSAGLFFILLMLYCWTQIFIDKRQHHRWICYTGMAISAALCAYTHYYAMLTAALLGIAGLFFVKSRKETLAYIASCLAAMLLFLPHIYITLHQLLDIQGNGEWVSKPTALFVLEYGRYLCHFSIWAPLSLLVVLITGSQFNRSTIKTRYKKIIVSLALFLLPLAIGYTYSVMVNPCLQYSCLLFSFPFLILLLCSLINDNTKYPTVAYYSALALFSIAMTLTLAIQRQHFKMMQLWSPEPVYNTIQHYYQLYGADSVTCFVDLKYLPYYHKDGDIEIINQYTCSQHSTKDIEYKLRNTTTPYIITARLWENEMDAVRHYYPTLLHREEMIGYEIVVRSTTPVAKDPKKSTLHNATFYSSDQEAIAQSEYYSLFDADYNAIADSRFREIRATLHYTIENDTVPLYIVIETSRGNKNAAYKINNITKSAWEKDSIYTCTLSQRMEDPITSHHALSRYHVKIYLWNPTQKKSCTIKDCQIEISPTNRYIYSHIEEIDD